MKTLLLPVIIAYVCLAACGRTGCTDANALNQNAYAKKDDGSCKYSRAYFYTTDTTHLNSTSVLKDIDYISLRVDGNYLGLVNYYEVYYSCTGIVYAFEDGEIHDWEATVHFTDSDSVKTQGTIQPNKNDQCISVDVTP